jgi:hypothetical protein
MKTGNFFSHRFTQMDTDFKPAGRPGFGSPISKSVACYSPSGFARKLRPGKAEAQINSKAENADMLR